ncbi:hypothetical protein Tco_1148580 [Tanacetum coccineum]
MSMNQKAYEEWEKKQPEDSGDVDDGRGKSSKPVSTFERTLYDNPDTENTSAQAIVNVTPDHGRWAEQVLNQWTLCKGKSVPTKCS